MSQNDLWDLAQDQFLLTRFKEGDTYSEIAKKMSLLFVPRSKNAVLGRANRMGLSRPKPKRKPKEEKRKIEQIQNPMVRRTIKGLQQPPIAIIESVAPFKTLDISIMELNNNTCRAMTGKATYCGHKRAEDSKSYCGWHHDRYYARSIKVDYNVG